MSPPYTPTTSNEAIREKTGKTWDEWFPLLDQWGAPEKGHTATAAHLQEVYDVPGWWAQNVTVEYERSRGLRAVGQKSDGTFAVSAQRTIAADVPTAKALWSDGRLRRRWLDDETLAVAVKEGMKGVRTSRTSMGDTLRFDVVPHGEEQKHLVQVTFTDLGDRTQVRLHHEKIPDKARRDALKARWSPLLDQMKRVAEA